MIVGKDLEEVLDLLFEVAVPAQLRVDLLRFCQRPPQLCFAFEVWGLGFGVLGFGFGAWRFGCWVLGLGYTPIFPFGLRVRGSIFRVQGTAPDRLAAALFRGQGLGLGVQRGLEFRVCGLGFRV